MSGRLEHNGHALAFFVSPLLHCSSSNVPRLLTATGLLYYVPTKLCDTKGHSHKSAFNDCFLGGNND
eukprot:scaffold8062_cov71-Cyclotella_meneghiniana.AAC.7